MLWGHEEGRGRSPPSGRVPGTERVESLRLNPLGAFLPEPKRVTQVQEGLGHPHL